MFRLTGFLLACAMVSGCSSGSKDASTAMSDLPSGEWKLVAFVDADGGSLPKPQFDSTLIVNQAERRIGGEAGCNRYMGGYEMADGSLSVGSIAASKRLCPEPQMKQEGRYLEWLGRAASAAMEKELLVITTSEREQLRFERAGA